MQHGCTIEDVKTEPENLNNKNGSCTHNCMVYATVNKEDKTVKLGYCIRRNK